MQWMDDSRIIGGGSAHSIHCLSPRGFCGFGCVSNLQVRSAMTVGCVCTSREMNYFLSPSLK